MHERGYSPLCECLDEVPSEPNLLPKVNRPPTIVVFLVEAMDVLMDFITSLQLHFGSILK